MKPTSNLLKGSVALFVMSVCCAASCHKTTTTTNVTSTDTTIVTTAGPAVDVWLTKGDKSALFQKQNTALHFGSATNANFTIDVDATQSFQTMDGFGFTLTGGSAQHLLGMSAAARAALLKELFDTTGNNIGIS